MNLIKSTLKPMLSLAVLAAVLAPSAAFALNLRVTPSTNALFGKEKMVHFSLRNQSGAAIDLRAGDQTMTVAPGKTVTLKLVSGTEVVTTTRTDKREVGIVVCKVSPDLSDTTIVLN